MVNMGVIKKLFFKPSVNKIYMYIILIIFLISLFLPVIHSFQINTIQLPNKQSFLNIELDCTDTTDIIKPFAEINCGPIPIQSVENGLDLTKQYQEIGISHIRTHDLDNAFFPCDIYTIFPDEDADPTLESSYDFTISDPYIASIKNANCEVLTIDIGFFGFTPSK